MPDIAIQVEGLGKRFQLGETVSYRTLRESLVSGVSGLFRRRRSKPERDEVWALRDVNFSVPQGEALGVIGPNGAGKSTLLKLLSGITEPTTGSAEIHGRVASLLEVGTGFHPELTGRENIYLNGAILGMPQREIRQRFDEIVDFSEVERFIDTPVKRYSSGMYMRLAFAVAAHLEPEILLVDEVLAVGDVAFQAKCLARMSDVTSRGRTVLFVSHNMAAVESLCDRALLVDKGKLIAQGKPSEIIEQYLANMTSAETTDLASRTDRSGSGLVRFKGIELQNRQGDPIDTLRSGQAVRIALDYERSPDDAGSVQVQVSFHSLHHQMMFKCNSSLSGASFDRLRDRGRFLCEIEQFPLPPGEYVVGVLGRTQGKLADSIQGATRIRVAGGDFYGTGRLPKDSRGGVLVAHKWRLDED